MARIRILLADDYEVLRQGMRRLLEDQKDLVVVAETADGTELPALIAAHRVDVVVLDLAMRGISGVETIRQLRARHGACRIMVLADQDDRARLQEALEAGAVGYMLKRATAAELTAAVRSVARGTAFVDTRLTPELVRLISGPVAGHPVHAPELTVRELHTLSYIAEGYSNKEIGAALRLSVKTVETYKARAMRKLGLRSRIDIVRIARERRWPPIG